MSGVRRLTISVPAGLAARLDVLRGRGRAPNVSFACSEALARVVAEMERRLVNDVLVRGTKKGD